MTNGQTAGSGTPMEDAAEDTGGVSGMMNLTINLPDNIRISTVDSDEEEETEVASAIVTGSIIAFAGGTAPAGWLLCNGAAISRATYADLFTVIGTNYGVGNANTTFNLPDFRGRFMLGVDNMGEVSADRVTATEADELGGSGGTEKHALTVDEMPSHFHQLQKASGYGGTNFGFNTTGIRTPSTAISSDNLDPKGGDMPHNNMPPWQTVNYIIKT